MGKEKKLPVFLTKEELEKFFNAINKPRDRLMFQSAYYFGLRVSELIKLTAKCINLKERMVIIEAWTAKGKKERRVPIPESFYPTIKQWLAFVGPDARLFSIGRERVWQLAKRYGSLAGIEKRMSPHVLRHSYATHVYTVTQDLRLCQALLGHTNINTTAIYAHCDDGSKRRGIEGVF